MRLAKPNKSLTAKLFLKHKKECEVAYCLTHLTDVRWKAEPPSSCVNFIFMHTVMLEVGKHGCQGMELWTILSLYTERIVIIKWLSWSLEIMKSRPHTGRQEANYPFSQRWWIPETTSDLSADPQKISMFVKWKKKKSGGHQQSPWNPWNYWYLLSFLIGFLDW